MSRIVLTLALAAALAPAAGAKQPARGPGGPSGPPPMMGGGRPAAASMLLAQTAELKLTDAQVTRLAGIARRSADRRAANRMAVDSLRTQFRPNAQGERPAGPPAAARTLMERVRTQQHEDLRDALAVLNPDQQATAFEHMARRGMMDRGGARKGQMKGNRGGMRGRGGQMGPGGPGGQMGPGGRMGPGMAPQPGVRMRQPGDSAPRRRP